MGSVGNKDQGMEIQPSIFESSDERKVKPFPTKLRLLNKLITRGETVQEGYFADSLRDIWECCAQSVRLRSR